MVATLQNVSARPSLLLDSSALFVLALVLCQTMNKNFSDKTG